MKRHRMLRACRLPCGGKLSYETRVQRFSPDVPATGAIIGLSRPYAVRLRGPVNSTFGLRLPGLGSGGRLSYPRCMVPSLPNRQVGKLECKGIARSVDLVR